MMKVHISAKIDSPCIANWAVKRTASQQIDRYEEEIIETIKQNCHMDYYLDCLGPQRERESYGKT